MKKKTLRFMTCAAVMALTLSVTACGDGSGSANSEIVQAEQDEEVEVEVEVEEMEAEIREEAQEVEAEAEEAEENADGEYATLEDYYNDPTVKAILDSQYSALAEEGMSASIEVKGNEFIVTIQFEDASMMVDGIEDAIDQMMEMQADVFQSAAAEFDEAIGQPGACTVTVRYLDPDGKVLSENSYKAKDGDASDADAGDYATLEDYYNDPAVKTILESQFGALASDGMSADIEVKGNEFIVIVQFEDASMMVDGIGDALDQMMESQAATFQSAAAEFDDAIGENGACTITVRYLDPDGKVLSENSYTAK